MARILVIEDNPANLQLMIYLLRAYGHSTIEALDGEAGLASARHERPDLILCDVDVPKMDGPQVARALKLDPELRRIPLVAVAALARVGDRERMLQAGFDGSVLKPIQPPEFHSRGAAVSVAGGARRPDVSPGLRPATAGAGVRREPSACRSRGHAGPRAGGGRHAGEPAARALHPRAQWLHHGPRPLRGRGAGGGAARAAGPHPLRHPHARRRRLRAPRGPAGRPGAARDTLRVPQRHLCGRRRSPPRSRRGRAGLPPAADQRQGGDKPRPYPRFPAVTPPSRSRRSPRPAHADG